MQEDGNRADKLWDSSHNECCKSLTKGCKVSKRWIGQSSDTLNNLKIARLRLSCDSYCSITESTKLL